MYINLHTCTIKFNLSQSSSIYIVETPIWIYDLSVQEWRKVWSNFYELALFQRSFVDGRNLSIERLNSCLYKLVSIYEIIVERLTNLRIIGDRGTDE